VRRRKRWLWLSAAMLLGGLLLTSSDWCRHGRAFAAAPGGSDAIGRFLEQHWVNPLPPQGPPPANYSPLEASLSPASCGKCHQQQYQDWRTSVHSHSIDFGILWQFRIMTQAQSNKCMRCHTPLAEQKALAALEFHWPNVPSSPRPAYVSPDLFHRGLVCAGCHVRHHHRFGPPPSPGMPAGNTPGLPHDGFTASRAFLSSRFCATCHQFPANGPALNGKLFENTYNEWRASRYAREGVTCQKCHMPHRRHLWRGIHDPAMVRQGLGISLQLKRDSRTAAAARVVIRSKAVGHDFPTYMVPKVYVRLYAFDARGRGRLLARKTIGRTVNVALNRELSDTRIPPGGSSSLSAHFAMPAKSAERVELVIDVAPEEHYERMFRHELSQPRKYDPTTEELLRDALAQAVTTRYRLVQLVAAVPSRIGQSVRKVAN
jgi:hypothetical protein